MKTYFVYIIVCADKSYYTGITSDLQRRINEHNEGTNKISYTSSRLPVELIWYQSFNDPDNAISKEKQIKGWSRKKKEALINKDWDKLPRLSECQNETHHRNYKSTEE
ncbi:MAG: GIY-YIG nuclease family protein [Flavobacteriales bacterium]|nr:GIY-YIG nuclease family protein [Flavobacteriales bacterium]